jgi:hypothetical protein
VSISCFCLFVGLNFRFFLIYYRREFIFYTFWVQLILVCHAKCQVLLINLLSMEWSEIDSVETQGDVWAVCPLTIHAQLKQYCVTCICCCNA